MHQTPEGHRWYLGMRLPIGVDGKTGLAHSAVVTAANVHDKHPVPQLLHGCYVRRYFWPAQARCPQDFQRPFENAA